ncbi:acetyltransferase, putative [Babesia ovata]|uniref:Acetyltransferase, putative n=1 Tax=Babesia ovata TaxID=189622 RepID=A0A2H6KBT7_9APIC|nr:acetyltransferase, putative [Babesia ovata]GBE60456.1 acetyltransferase, putative [Babesia ovata]
MRLPETPPEEESFSAGCGGGGSSGTTGGPAKTVSDNVWCGSSGEDPKLNSCADCGVRPRCMNKGYSASNASWLRWETFRNESSELFPAVINTAVADE